MFTMFTKCSASSTVQQKSVLLQHQNTLWVQWICTMIWRLTIYFNWKSKSRSRSGWISSNSSRITNCHSYSFWYFRHNLSPWPPTRSQLLLAQSCLHSSKYFLELHVCVNVAVAFFGNQNISVEEIIQLKGNSPLCLLWSRLPPTTWTSSLPEVSLVASPVISSLPGNLSSSCCFNFRNLGAYPHPPL